MSSLGAQTVQVEPTNAFAAEVSHFLKCIATGAEPTNGNIPDSIKATAVALAARASLDLGVPVKV